MRMLFLDKCQIQILYQMFIKNMEGHVDAACVVYLVVSAAMITKN